MNPNQALWEKGDFTQIAAFMRQSGEAVVESIGIRPPAQVLDLGCGDGTTAVPLARTGADVTGGGDVNLIGSAEVAGHCRGSDEQNRRGHNTLRFEHNLLFDGVFCKQTAGLSLSLTSRQNRTKVIRKRSTKRHVRWRRGTTIEADESC